MYYYEDYMLKETPNGFVVSELLEESGKVRIKKSLVEKFETDNTEAEMIAILLGKIELIRIDSARVNKTPPKSFLKEERFYQKLNVLLLGTTIENVLEKIHDMKFHELEKYFLTEFE